MIFDLAECEEIACHSFKDKQLLRTAFTHTSYANERHCANYERLEYLGDALLDFLVAEYLYKNNPHMEEGEMTTLRARLVSKPALKQIAEDLKMGNLVLLGEGGEKTGERKNDKILSSLLESLIAAVYLDGGMDAARKFAEKRILSKSGTAFAKVSDYKTELQEYVQKRKLGAIAYVEKARTGPSHSPTFSVAVTLKGKTLAVGNGGKKQVAEQEAAKIALLALTENPFASEKAEKKEKKGERTPARSKAKQQEKQAEKGKKQEKQKGQKKENPVLSLVADYGVKEKTTPPSKKDVELDKTAKPQRVFRERPMPKNKPEKAKNFSAFAGDFEIAPHKEKPKKEKQKPAKPLFARKRSTGGDGTPL
ncbi:MAG: ribonuclease III [Clostridiales bacterium]|nr:ribonuclease III [Clostridiales bacterium]